MADANTRPVFTLPFQSGTHVTVKSYVGHNPDDKKTDMYAENWPPVVASAPGVVHEHFEPGGIEIRHFIPGTNMLGNWYTTYMHMSSRAAVGAKVNRGDWVGVAGSVGTGAKHLHYEQLQDHSPDGDADNRDIVYPAFAEYQAGRPFKVPVGDPGLHLVSGTKSDPVPTPPRPPHKLHQGTPVPALIARGTGQYFGSITGPNTSHGGFNPYERPIIKVLQQRLIVCGFVPGIKDPNDGWADGIFDTQANPPGTGETSRAVSRFQHAHMPHTQFYGQVWWDDWEKLFNI